MEPIRVASNEYWGRRFGTYSDHKPKNCQLPWGNHFPKVGYGSKSGNSNKSVNTAQSNQSKADQKLFAAFRAAHGYPALYIKPNNRRDREKEATKPKPHSSSH